MPTHLARFGRARFAALVSGLALAGSLMAAPASVFAQDGPEAPVQALFDAIVEKRFDDITATFCPEFAEQAAELDLATSLAATLGALLPPGTDPQLAVDAVALSIDGLTLDVLSEEGDTATVSLEATLLASLDPETAGPFVAALLEASGFEVTDDMVALMVDQIAPAAKREFPLSEVVTVTRGEDGAWLICSQLGGPGATPDPTAPADPSGAPSPSPSGDPAGG